MFIYFFFFALNIITILFKATYQKDICSFTSNNNTLLNYSENINDDIQLLEISYNQLIGLINLLKSSPRYIAETLMTNELDGMIKDFLKTILKEDYINLIMDIKKYNYQLLSN